MIGVKKDVITLKHAMNSDTTVADLVLDLSGQAFCQSPELAFDKSQTETCHWYIADFMPKALRVLFPVPNESVAEGICSYYDALC